jgi:lipoate-protein ligase A
MRCILSHETDPALNLATEEVLLGTAQEPVFRVWRNRPAVIIGRHQNPYTQVDLAFVRQARLPVIRRISGGGAVYQDLGNVNFTFVRPAAGQVRIDYRTPLTPVRKFLATLGITAVFDGDNTLAVAGKKISGNAQHISQGRVLHHGTLLFDADLAALSRSLLAAVPERYRDKSVDSVRRTVSNIRPMIDGDLGAERFMEALADHISRSVGGGFQDELAPEETRAAERLVQRKYTTWEWNVGQSPDYAFVGRYCDKAAAATIRMQVGGGVIRQIDVTGDAWPTATRAALAQRLTGRRHRPDTLAPVLASLLGKGDVLAPDDPRLQAFF